MTKRNSDFGRILKQRRLMVPLTMRKLATASGISPSYLGRIERGERFPSASILMRMAQPLALTETELFSLAGYLTPPAPGIREKTMEYAGGKLDPYVAEVLSEEPIEVQRAVIGILNILKSIANIKH